MLENETTVTVETLLAEARRLREEGARLVTATGLDGGDHFEIIYTFNQSLQLGHFRLAVPKADSVPSLSGVFPGAFLIENEMKELLGVQVTGLSVDYGGKLFKLEGNAKLPLAKTPVVVGGPNGNGKAASGEVGQ